MYIDQDYSVISEGGLFENGNASNTQRILGILIWKMTFNQQNNKIA